MDYNGLAVLVTAAAGAVVSLVGVLISLINTIHQVRMRREQKKGTRMLTNQVTSVGAAVAEVEKKVNGGMQRLLDDSAHAGYAKGVQAEKERGKEPLP